MKFFTVISLILSLILNGSNSIDLNINPQEQKEYDQVQTDHAPNKTILSTGKIFGDNQKEYSADLYYEDGVYLNVGNSTIPINHSRSDLSENLYEMETLGSAVAVIQRFITATGSYVDVNFYTYDGEEIQSVFSTANVLCKIDHVEIQNGEVGEVSIGLPFAKSSISYTLTNDEKERTEEVISELEENQIEMNDEFMESIAENIICSPLEVVFADVNQNGENDVLFLINLKTVGAKTPVRINSNAVFLFEIKDLDFQLNRVLLFSREAYKGKVSFLQVNN